MTTQQPPQPSTTELIVTELARIAEPMRDAIERGEPGVLELLDESHLLEQLTREDIKKIVEILKQELTAPLQTLDEKVLTPLESGEAPSLTDIDDIVGAIDTFTTGIKSLDDLQFSNDAIEIGATIFDYLVVRFIHRYHNRMYNVLCVAGIIVERGPESPADLRLSKLDDLVTAPNQLIVDTFEWGSDEFHAFSVLFYLKWILNDMGLMAEFRQQVPADIQTLNEHVQAGKSLEELKSELPGLEQELSVPVLTVLGENGWTEAGIKLVPLPGNPGNSFPGLAVVPFGELQFDEQIELSEEWVFNSVFSTETTDWGLLVRPGESHQFKNLSDGEAPATVHGYAGITYDPSGEDGRNQKTLLGNPNGSRLALGSISGRITVDYRNDEVIVEIVLPASGTLGVHPSDFDGFLSNILPQEGVFYDFDATVGWSSKTGLFFERGGTLEASIPQHTQLGPVELTEIYLAVIPDTDDSGLSIEGAASGSVELGPVTGTIQRMGIAADVSFPEDRDGNLGLLELDLGFKPPDGLALSIDTGAVTGGGFMTFEPEKYRYSGGLELQFGSWGLKVVGLLKTKLPRTDGYSLLLLVTADLPPIQLGFGFVMTGIGGLAGIHRSFETKPLSEAVRSGNLDSVLFPEKVIANADQILTDLRAIFPPKADRHVFGPMLRLGWGTPVIITAELGVLVSIPSWKIALLGKFMVDLPDEQVSLIDLNLAVLGVLDIPNQELAIDASLYDSRIVAWTVSGDMAMRLSWGDDSRFMLSVGGFHPRYDPPTGFPKLDRVTATLSPPGGNPRLEYTGYLAVTPNTFQVGAGVVLHGEFGPAVVHGELSFDALFRFNPFSFVVDVYAGVSVTISGYGLSLKLDGTLSGPQPYRVNGKLSIEILFFSVTVNVDAKFGESGGKEELPIANVLPELTAQLEQPANWSVQKPADGHHLVTLWDPDADRNEDAGQPQSEVLLAHPLGTLAVRQQVVPLGVAIEKYGNAKPRHTTYELSNLWVAGSDDNLAGQRHLKEKFAPARFKEMTDSEKLKAEPFERLPAGRTMDNGIVHYAGAKDSSLLSWATLAYESSVIDEKNNQFQLDTNSILQDFVVDDAIWDGRLGLAISHELAEQSAVATTETRTTGLAAYENPDSSKQVGVSDQRYVVAGTDNLERVPFAGNPEDGQTRVEAREARDEYLATHDVASDEVQVVGVHELSGGSGGDGL